jgi:hypothetical protein
MFLTVWATLFVDLFLNTETTDFVPQNTIFFAVPLKQKALF